MHISVLKDELINNLNLKEDSIIVDGTLGYAGDSSIILERIKKGFLFAFDQDSEAIEYSTNVLNKIGTNFTIIKSNFVNLKQELNKRGIEKIDGAIFDLGVSSPQLDNGRRGFSYHEDARLDMRMDKDNPLDAYYVVNNYDLNDLTRIFRDYGEDKFAYQIAKKIVKQREEKPIETTLELVEVIKSAVPEKEKRKKHPAKQIFQAIRIEVNHELDVIKPALEQALEMLNVGGRVEVITFHSLEDKIVKKYFKEVCSIDDKIKGLPNIPKEYLPDFKLVVNKAIIPTDKELENNNRARSAKLRIIERVK
ncbi:MAG: 16S rRNA (cytosine(1402)-N(4))-methyltransferase RsmH [Clostridia bacterium]|jgi:16S rRNA (cytosine1402-N4)-methyltransferase|uniref:S-adenosyl-L-methionine-dependent methyltransferase mraW n=1 Tax=human gut metagenome TaxID=408170 RepID=K1S922_9ZZZZ|nr:16S rRNA (cytosine(1402)-N(4))-methyltransferase RsmH [Clostridium sp.]MEE0092536.1 16S rRNA (cytosine(1402)-N(4))-methyltransferase RsmH [Bacilli bacterium]CDC60953.1 ribosomal RNA small subunit methyltransferase H [Clostridium sp. CAG:417]